MNVEIIIDLLMKHFDAINESELAAKMGMSQQAINSWKKREAISAIKKKCRELGIYDVIFGSNTQFIGSISGGQNANIAGGDMHGSSGSTIPIKIGWVSETTGKSYTVDKATMALFKEAFEHASESNKLKDFRIYLMDYGSN